MIGKDFYVTLPSNCAMTVFPDNATSHYTTPLHRRIDLPCDYEVSVCEVSFPTLMENISAPNNEIIIRTVDPQVLKIKLSDTQKKLLTTQLEPLGAQNGRLFIPTRGADRSPVDVVHVSAYSIFKVLTESQKKTLKIKSLYDIIKTDTVFITPGYYTQIDQLLKFINEKLSHLAELTSNGSDKISVKITAEPMIVVRTALYFSDVLCMQLGFLPGTDILSCSSSEHPVDLSRGIPQTIFLYSDCVENSIVGDKNVPLLRTVNARVADKIQWGLTTKIFNSPYYIRVNKRSITSIEMNLRDSLGNYIPFINGTSTVVLHFRPIA